MSEIDKDIHFYEYLKSNIYFKMRSKTIITPIKIEYKVFLSLLMDQKIALKFFQNVLPGIFFIIPKQIVIDDNLNIKIINKEDYMKYNSIIRITLNNEKNVKNSNISNIENNKDKNLIMIFKQENIYSKQFENHSIQIFRSTEIAETSKLNKKNFVDIVVLVFKNIKDNSSMIIHEIYTNFPDNVLNKFYDIMKDFSEKLQKYIYQNLTTYFVNESIVIHRNIHKVIDYIKGCKIFYNKNYQIKHIKKFGEAIEVLIEVKDPNFPKLVCENKVIIEKISENESYVLINNYLKNINDEKFKEKNFDKLLEVQPSIKMFLKLLRKKIEDNFNNNNRSINKEN